MSESDIKEQVKALQAKLAAMEASQKSSSVVYMKSDRKFPKFAGRPEKDSDPDVIEWITDMREYIASKSSKDHHVDFIMDHLTGSAKSEIRLRPPEQRKTADQILNILEQLYHIKDTVTQLQQKFYQRDQHADETLESYSLELMKIADQITRRAGKEMSDKDKILVERFIDGLRDQHLRQELRKFSIDKGPLPFLEFRHLMLKWIEDNPPSTDKHIHKTSSENSELLSLMKQQQDLLEKQQEQIDHLTKLTSGRGNSTYTPQYYGRSRSYSRYPRGYGRGRGRGTGDRGRGRSYPDRKELICYNCGGKGHKSSECPSDNFGNEHSKQSDQNKPLKENPNGRPPRR